MTTTIWQMVIRLSAFTVVMTDRASPLGTTSSPIKYFSTNLDEAVRSVAMSPDGRIVAAVMWSGIVCVWDADTDQLVERLRGDTSWYSTIAFTPDGKGLVSGSTDDSPLKYWDISNMLRGGKAMPKEMKDARRNGEESKEGVRSLAVSQDGEWIVSGLDDGGVQIWDARTRELQLVLRGHTIDGLCQTLCNGLIANDSCGFLVSSIAISSQRGMIASRGLGGPLQICKCMILRVLYSCRYSVRRQGVTDRSKPDSNLQQTFHHRHYAIAWYVWYRISALLYLDCM
jgi:WD40 repeat protein